MFMVSALTNMWGISETIQKLKKLLSNFMNYAIYITCDFYCGILILQAVSYLLAICWMAGETCFWKEVRKI
jgi:hypothetical protein